MIESIEDVVQDVVSTREDWDVTEVTMDGEELYAYKFHYAPNSAEDMFDALIKETVDEDAFLVLSTLSEDANLYGFMVEWDDTDTVEKALYDVLTYSEETEETHISINSLLDGSYDSEYDWFDG